MPTSSTWLLIALFALPFAGSCAASLMKTNARDAEAYVDGGIIRYTAAWAPELGLWFDLRMDGFAWVLSMLITGIGFLVVLYARYYMSPADPVARLFSLLLAFMGAMLGIVLSGNLIQLVFFWELTSIFSFLLIGYWHQNSQARNAARMALIVTTAGGLCLFAGILLLAHIVGSYDLDHVLAAAPTIRSHSLYLPTLVLVVQ